MTTEPLPPDWQLLRKKPVIVAAIVWTGDNEAQVQAVTGTSDFYAVGPEDREDPDQTATVYDKLHSTWVNVYTGQSIVRGVKGEFYPLADDVRAETYEAVAALAADPCTEQPGGQWLRIAFMGHVELTGYVTEITLGGQAAFHVDLPEKIWGGNPHAWQEYAATALYSRRPVTEESVREAWEAARASRAEWEARQQRYALEAGDDADDPDDEDPF